jgi:hypothetical protein
MYKNVHVSFSLSEAIKVSNILSHTVVSSDSSFVWVTEKFWRINSIPKHWQKYHELTADIQKNCIIVEPYRNYFY